MSIGMVPVIIFAVINVIAFFIYGIDKKKAIEKEWRIPESTLLAVSFFGPWGAMAGMNVYRHKTQKPKFKLVYVFAIVHIIIVGFLLF